ncbi:MAG TPA: glycosyltransferase family 4 protein [Thermoanaerobaculia bacterium]|nr:glycosyltransferase family 4 protein [Thermoanaerobaculia bacterium]
MRILSLSNCPLDEHMGSGYVTLGYARRLRERGHEVDLLGPAEFEPLRRLGRGTGYRQALGMATASLRRLAANDYDVVEFWGGEAWLALALLAWLPRRPFLLVAHSNGLETHCAELLRAAEADGRMARSRRWFQLDQSPLAERGFRAADALVTVGGFDRDYALERGYAEPQRALAVDNPLPEEYLGIEVDFARPRVIGYCGSWIPRKGVALLEASLPSVLRALPEWRLVLVGVGDGFRPDEHFPADLLARVEVVPYAERGTQLRALYQGLSILLLPSVYESFGLAAAEGMACGAALVASPVGFAAGLRDRHEALLLNESSPQALQEAIESLARDEELRQRIARGGHRRVQSLRWDDAVVTVEAAYLRWLAELRGARQRPAEGLSGCH